MPKSRIPSPARSQSAVVTPRRYKPRGPRSVGSPARSNTSVRLTCVIQNFKDKNMDSFRLSPLTSRRSVLNDNTDIEDPKRNSWWKKLNDTSRDIMEVLENEKQDEPYNVMEEYMDVEVLSQEKKDKTLNLPDSSDNESISSIVIPQRKLFTQKENHPQNKFAQLLGTRDNMAELDKTGAEPDKSEKTIVAGTKKLFGHSSKARSKPAFPTELLRFSPDKTVNKTAGEVKGQVRNLFGNRAGVKRKNKFADFIASESEDEPEIQPKVFGFQKKLDVPSRRVSTTSRGTRDPSPTSSVTTDIDMDDWKLLPSSTMVQNQLEAMMTDSPAKKARLSKLSEGKESEATNSTAAVNKTKQSNKSVTSKNKSKLSKSNNSMNKSKRNKNLQKSTMNEEVVYQTDAEDYQVQATNGMAVVNKTTQSNISLNKSKSKVSRSLQKSAVNDEAVYQNDEQDDQEKTTNIKNAKQADKSVNSKNKSLLSKSNSSLNKSKVTKNLHKSAVSGQDGSQNDQEGQVKELDEMEGIRLALANSDEEPIEANYEKQRIDNSSENILPKNVEDIDNSQENTGKIPNNADAKIVNESEEKNDSEGERWDNNPISEDEKEKSKTEEEKEVQDMNKENYNRELMEHSQEIEKAHEDDKGVDNEKDDNEDIEMDEENEIQDQSQIENESDEVLESEVEEEHENEEQDESQVENESEQEQESEEEHKGQESEVEEQDENQEIINEDVNDGNDRPNEKNSEVNSINGTEEDTPNVSHDTTGRHRKKNDTNVKSPEAVLRHDIEHLQSFTAKGRNTSVRKTSMIKNLNIRPSLAPPRESTGLSDGTKNSSGEGSGWDSHRTTRKTLRQTFGRDFTPRKSLRALVMEKSAKRQTAIHDINDLDMPRANSTELPESPARDDVVETDNAHEDKSNDQEEQVNAHIDESTEQEEVEHSHIAESEAEEDNTNEVGTDEHEVENNEPENESKIEEEDNVHVEESNDHEYASNGDEEESNALAYESDVQEEESNSHEEDDALAQQSNVHEERDEAEEEESTALEYESDSHEDKSNSNQFESNPQQYESNAHQYDSNSHVEEDSLEVDENCANDISKRTRQTTLEMYLQKIKKQNMENKKKLEEEVKNSLKAPTRDILNPFKVPNRPFVFKRATKSVHSKPKTKPIRSMIPLEDLPKELIEDMKYKPPRRFQPSNASWITKRLYKFLESKLEGTYDYKARIRAEKLVETIYNFAKDLRRHDVAPADAVEVLKHEMARLCVVTTHFDFYQFFHDYMPREIRVKVVPDVVNKIPLPRQGVFADILRGTTVQG